MEEQEGYLVERLLIGASGSIGVVNLPAYLILFKKLRVAREIRVIMTDQAAHFIPTTTIELFTDSVYTDMIDRNSSGKVMHLELARWADLFVVFPASADLIGKAAHGIATDLLSTTLLAAQSPVVFVPNMNPAMYNKPAVQRNLRQLQEDGCHIIEPEIQRGYEVSSGKIVETMSFPQAGEMAKRFEAILQESSTLLDK